MGRIVKENRNWSFYDILSTLIFAMCFPALGNMAGEIKGFILGSILATGIIIMKWEILDYIDFNLKPSPPMISRRNTKTKSNVSQKTVNRN